MSDPDPNTHYYVSLAAAFVRGRLEPRPTGSDGDVVAAGRAAGLRVHRFKRNAELPRVRRVLGILSGLAPGSLLDVGSGRGTFLWPLLDTLRESHVMAIDRDHVRARDLGAVQRGGIGNLHAARMDATRLALADASFDVVTALEVLEHLEHPARAAREAVRVARSFVVASVPSRPDDNPEHIQLFTTERLTRLLTDAGAARVNVESVRGHLIAIARVS
ncbi:MAG: class I SAM-dependent methyltransferase [bacterium]|nr:class I SAM-dependent methyltransferase [bacterium]